MGQKIDLSFQVQGILPEENGGAGPLAGIRFFDNETPSGAVDGSNSTFTLATAPTPAGSLLLFSRPPGGAGILFFQIIDYTLAGATITTTTPPASGGNLRAWYRSNQKVLVIHNEMMSQLDSVALRLLFSGQQLDSINNELDMFSFVLRPSAGRLVDRMILQDGFSMQVVAAKTLSDTMSLSDAFAKLLV